MLRAQQVGSRGDDGGLDQGGRRGGREKQTGLRYLLGMEQMFFGDEVVMEKVKERN